MPEGYAQRELAPPAAGEILAPAKINLTLEILARRDDGYHTLRSVMVPLAWYDRLRWEPAKRFTFVSSDPAIQNGNIVARALARLGFDAQPLCVTLEKQLPYGAGLGSGSSDAAAVLLAAMHGRLGASTETDWIALARSLGSDVPFFLAQTAALVEGTGERVTALGRVPPWWVVVYVPPVAVATGPAYAALDAQRDANRQPSRARSNSASILAGEALQRADFCALVETAQNDFEPVIAGRYPEIAAALASLRACGARLAMLSGSGSSVFALAEDEAEARSIARRLPLDPQRLHVVPLHAGDAWR